MNTRLILANTIRVVQMAFNIAVLDIGANLFAFNNNTVSKRLNLATAIILLVYMCGVVIFARWRKVVNTLAEIPLGGLCLAAGIYGLTHLPVKAHRALAKAEGSLFIVLGVLLIAAYAVMSATKCANDSSRDEASLETVTVDSMNTKGLV